MSINVSADESAQLAYVRFGDRGLVYVLDVGGNVTTQLQDTRTDPMITEDEAVSRVLELITDVPLPAKHRERLARALDVDADDVGRAP